MAFWSAVTSGNIGRMWQARRSSTQLPEIMSAPVGIPSASARPSSPIHAFMRRRECSCTWPWYCRSVIAVAIGLPPHPDPSPPRERGTWLVEEHGFDESLDLVPGALEGPHL